MKTNTTNNMKKLVLLVLLFTGIVNAQIVNIPDANFKNRLVNTECVDNNNDGLTEGDVDLNNDGEIQINEATNVIQLYIQNNNTTPSSEKIQNLVGIENFTNLERLNCSYNKLTNLNLINENLKYLVCSFNELTSFNTNNNIHLNQLSCTGNLLTSLNIDNNVELVYLNCDFNQLPNLSINNNILLKALNCSYNFLTSINVVNNTLLNSLYINNNIISNLNISANVNLKSLNCGSNQITELNLNNNMLLDSLECYDNLLISLDISNLLFLQDILISKNQITNFTLPNPLNLIYFNCSFNNLSQIDVSKIICNNYDFSNNPNLTYINMKNGHQDGCVVLLQIGLDYICSRFLGLPNLQFICVDEGEADFWTIPSNISMSSYCSFTPGGQFNTITGSTTFDSNLNGCDLTDPVISNIKIGITDITNSGSSYSNNLGVYNFYSTVISQNIFPILENPTYFNANPTVVAVNFLEGTFGQVSNQNFCISPNGIHPDLEVVLAPITPARPGFDAVYQLIYKNKGNQTLNGVVSLNYDVFRLLFISSNTTPDFNFEGTIDWNFTNLLPFESRSISLTLNVNSPVETPPVNIGDVLNFTATINPISGDELPDDNTFTLAQTVVGSFDPNDITCLDGNSVAPSEIGEYLHYVINFENTGNFPAENVVVKTIIDPAKFDINSLQLLDTSAPVDTRITGNVVEFIFKNVQLAGPGGHGHVLLKVKSKNSLVAGDSVANRADIFFDYNAPVDTGLETTIFQSLSNSVFVKDDSINVLPNPTNGNVTINSNFNIKNIEVYDVQGRILQTIINSNNLDISERENGIYFLKITTEKGSKIEKLVKE